MKTNKVIIIDSNPSVHKNIEAIFNQLEPSREFISFYSQVEAFNLFTYFHYLNEQDILFIDLELAERIIKILTNSIIHSPSIPKIYLISSQIDFPTLFSCQKNKAVIDFIPKPIIFDDIQPLVA